MKVTGRRSLCILARLRASSFSGSVCPVIDFYCNEMVISGPQEACHRFHRPFSLIWSITSSPLLGSGILQLSKWFWPIGTLRLVLLPQMTEVDCTLQQSFCNADLTLIPRWEEEKRRGRLLFLWQKLWAYGTSHLCLSTSCGTLKGNLLFFKET